MLLLGLELTNRRGVTQMGAILSGCFTFICMIFLLAYCIQYPAIFWGIVAVFFTAIVLGVRKGIKRGKEKKTRPATARDLRIAAKHEDEGDIRHHYGYDGTPHNISSPETIQNETLSLGDEEEEHH